jgi:hypothetical protein
MTGDNCGEWQAVNLHRVVYIQEGEKKILHSSSSSRANAVMLDLLEQGIPAWCEKIEELDDGIPF